MAEQGPIQRHYDRGRYLTFTNDARETPLQNMTVLDGWAGKLSGCGIPASAQC